MAITAAELMQRYEDANRRGDIDGKIDALRNLISVAQQGGNPFVEIAGFRWLGNALQEKGLMQRAHAARVTAYDLVKELGPDCPPVLRMEVEGDLGRSFIEVHDWVKAEPHTRAALAIAEELKDEAAMCALRLNLGMILAGTDRMAEAITLGEQVIRDAERLGNNYVLGLQHLNLAGLLLNRQVRLNDCQRHARKALAYATGDKAVQARARKVLGQSYSMARVVARSPEYARDAEHFLLQTMETARTQNDAATLAETLAQLGTLFADRRKPAEAARYFRDALEALERVRSTLGYEDFQLSYFRNWQPFYDEITVFLLRNGQTEQALRTSEQLRSRLLMAMFGQRRTIAAAWSEEQRSRLMEVLDAFGSEMLRIFRSDVASGQRGLTVGRRGAEDLADDTPPIRAAHEAFLRLHESQRLYSPMWTPRQAPPVAPVESIRAALKADEAVLAYHLTGNSVIIFVVTDRDCRFQQLPYSREHLEADIEAVCSAVSDEERPEPRTLLEKLYPILIAPVLAVAAAKRHWTIVPHGPLHRLPWAALRDGARYLIEEHSISLLPSAGFGAALAKSEESSGREAIFFGDPDSGDELLGLPGSAAEVQAAFEALRTGSPPFTGARATKRELLARAPTAGLLHIAAHHFFDASVPLLSFLKLAGDRGEDFLYALDVAGLQLSAQLVSLSACETARSRIDTGDEQYGMVRAFLAAGAKSVMSTLWLIDDDSAAALLADFYARARQESLGTALAEAQRALLRSDAYSHPYHWAGYALSGQWSWPLRLGSPNP